MDMIQLISWIVLWLCLGTATAYFADQRGRDPLVWFMLGMLLGFLGLLLLFLLPPVSDEGPVEEAEYNLLNQKEVSPQSHDYMIKEWFYYDDRRNRQGPIRFENLRELWKKGHIGEETFVWSEGMDGWKKIEEIQNLYAHLQLAMD